jgi:hypothetical protein
MPSAQDSPPDEEVVDFFVRRYPPANISPDQFEQFVVELFQSAAAKVTDLGITLHEKVKGVDGAYDFDATVRYQFLGMDFLVVVEVKRHNHPIKREQVQVLHSKCLSVGAHKGVLVSTAPFQRGAIEFAKVHGIALVSVTEGRFTYETKSVDPPKPPSRAEAAERFGLPTFVGHCFSGGDTPGTTQVTLMSTEYPDYVAEHLLGLHTRCR